MTTINPVFIYELIKQKTNWNTKLTPVSKISDFVETFNTSNNLNLIISGKDITKLPEACKSGNATDKNNVPIENLGTNIKTVIINLKNICIFDGRYLRVDMDLYGYDKKMSDLLVDKKSEEELLTPENLGKAVTKGFRFASIDLGKAMPDANKKDVLGLLITLLTSEYSKIDPKLKDGNLKQQLLNEIGLLISDGQKYVELLDATQLVQDDKLCDVSDSNVNNTMTITNITKFSMLNEGKEFCLDLDILSYFAQSRIQTISLAANGSKMSSPSQIQNGKNDDSKGMVDSGKITVLESYVAGLLDQVYKDKNKYKVEILRPTNTTILLKITDNQTKEILFNKVDITNAVSEGGVCGAEKTDSRIREYVTLQKYCKGSKFYKIQFVVNGSDHTKITNKQIPFAKLEEAKDQKMFAEYINVLHSANPKSASSPQPKSAIVFYSSPWNSYGGVYSGLYGLGLYNAGIYAYPRLGCGALGCAGGIYGYPYSYGGVYGLSSVYTPPLVSSIVPTAPYVSAYAAPVISSPIVSAPIYSTATPLTYNYPIITTSNYTLGSYYSPYLGYGYGGYGYSYGSPFQYTYTTPYTYVKSEEKRIKLDKNDVLPTEASSMGELVDIIKDFHPSAKIEKIGNMVIKVDIEKNLIKESHYYGYDEGKIYLAKDYDVELI